MSYNGSGTFQINSAGQPVVTGTVISSTAFNALTADLATGLSTAITKDGQTTTTSRILFAQGISSTLTTDATSTTTGSIITAGGISTQKALFVGTTSNFAGTITAAAANFSGAVVITANNALKITATNPIIRFDQTGTGAVVHRLQAQVVAAGDIGFYNETSAATPFYITSGDVNTFSTAMSYGGVTLSNSVTGTGSMVLSTSPQFATSVGIGMTPTVPLSVLGPVYATGAIAAFRGPNSGPCGIDFTVAAGMVASIKFDNTTTLTGNANSIQIVTGAGSISFAPSGTECARFDTSGSLLVGTTTASGKLTVSTNAATYGRVVTFSSNTASDISYEALGLVKFDNNSTTSQVFQKFFINAGGAICGQINANGASNAAFGAASDVRIKENITDLPPQLANIMAMRPVEFDYIEERGGGHQIGFIAQDMEAIYSDTISTDSDGMLVLTGWSKTDARIVKAIQELTTRLAALENK